MRLKRFSTFIVIGLTTTALVVGLASARPSSFKSLKAAATAGQKGQRVLEPARKAIVGAATRLTHGAVPMTGHGVRRNVRWTIGALKYCALVPSPRGSTSTPTPVPTTTTTPTAVPTATATTHRRR